MHGQPVPHARLQPRHEHRRPRLAGPHVEDDEVARIAGEEGVVGDDHPRAVELHARRLVERDRAAVVPRRVRREAAELLAGLAELHDLVCLRPDECQVHVAGARDREPIRTLLRTALPDLAEHAGLAVRLDRKLVELAGGRVPGRRHASRACVEHQRSVVRQQDDPGRTEERSVDLRIREPDLRLAAPGRHTPDHRLLVVGDVHAAVGAPGRVVRLGRVVHHRVGAVRRLQAGHAGRHVAERRVRRLGARAGVQHEHARRVLVEQVEDPARVDRRHLDAVRGARRLPLDRVGPAQLAVRPVGEDLRRAGVAALRVGERAHINGPVGRDQGERRVSRVGHVREHARVPLLPRSRGRGAREARRECEGRDQPPPSAHVARSPEGPRGRRARRSARHRPCSRSSRSRSRSRPSGSCPPACGSPRRSPPACPVPAR